MKRILSLALCVLLVMGLFAGCGNAESENTTTETTVADVPDDGILKILAIGNSFSEDAMQMLYEIAQAEGKEQIVLGNMVIGGCSLNTHAKHTTSNEKAYTFYFNDKGFWNTEDKCTLQAGIRRADWDIITIQQASNASGKANTYNQDIQTIVDYIHKNKANPGAKILWHMTWAYKLDSTSEEFANYDYNQTTMYEAITGAVQEKIVPDSAFSGVLPSGTAIQNARSSYLGDVMNRDGAHLSDLGRVIAGYTWYCVLTGKTLDTISLNAVPDRLTKSYDMPGDMVLTEGEKLVIAEAVKNAIANPYTVTQSQYTTEPGK